MTMNSPSISVVIIIVAFIAAIFGSEVYMASQRGDCTKQCSNSTPCIEACSKAFPL